PVAVLPGREPADGRAHVEPAPNIAGNLNLERLSLWRAALQMLLAHPLAGVGAGNYRLVLGDYIGQSAWDNRLHANNSYLEMFADSGLPGGALFVVLIGAALWRGVRALRRVQAPESMIRAASLTAALAAFAIHGLSDYFLEFTPIYLLFWIPLGGLAAMADPARSRTGK